jgi:hypothetical protein
MSIVDGSGALNQEHLPPERMNFCSSTCVAPIA